VAAVQAAVQGVEAVPGVECEKVKRDVTVYNVTVDGTHNYFVSNGKTNFLVHNKGGGQ